jgi:linoleoyl-CoA desaturase
MADSPQTHGRSPANPSKSPLQFPFVDHRDQVRLVSANKAGKAEDPSTLLGPSPQGKAMSSALTTELRRQVMIEVEASRARPFDRQRAIVELLVTGAVLWITVWWLIQRSNGVISDSLGVLVVGLMLGHSLMKVHGGVHRPEVSPNRLWFGLMAPTGPLLNRRWWQAKHQTMHHGSLNRFGEDNDLHSNTFLRFSPSAKRTWLHGFQHRYASLLTFFLFHAMVSNAVRFAFTGKVDAKQVIARPSPRATAAMLAAQWWCIVPIALLARGHRSIFAVAGAMFVIYGIAGFIVGHVLAVQHANTLTQFPPADQGKFTRDEMTYWCLAGAVNIATSRSPWGRFTAWYTDYLTFHVAHHLFPGIESRHLPAASVGLQRACAENGLPYLTFANYREAVASWWGYLEVVGAQRSYDPIDMPLAGRPADYSPPSFVGQQLTPA